MAHCGKLMQSASKQTACEGQSGFDAQDGLAAAPQIQMHTHEYRMQSINDSDYYSWLCVRISIANFHLVNEKGMRRMDIVVLSRCICTSNFYR